MVLAITLKGAAVTLDPTLPATLLLHPSADTRVDVDLTVADVKMRSHQPMAQALSF